MLNSLLIRVAYSYNENTITFIATHTDMISCKESK